MESRSLFVDFLKEERELRIIAVANHKGGCGKTTTSINFSACLARLQKKVLLIDLDPQRHSTCGLGIHAEVLPHTLYDLLSPTESKKLEPFQVLQEINPYFFLLPTYGILSALEEELVQRPNRENCLKEELISRFEGAYYDYIILDCPPNLGVLTFNALNACDEVMIPVEPSFFSLHGLAKISETLEMLNQRRTCPIEDHALLTLFDSRTCFAKEVYEEVRDHFQDRLFKTIIHECITLKEAASAGMSIVDYDIQSIAFQDYMNLATEYLERQWNRVLPEKRLGWNRVLHSRYGPRRVMGGILFQAMSGNAQWVEIAGEFNNWIPEPMIRRSSEGLWQKVIPITKGKYRYKFIVDGEWQVDPFQPVKQSNAFGTTDSILELSQTP